jgi:uncharacterized protein (DUF885 family)
MKKLLYLFVGLVLLFSCSEKSESKDSVSDNQASEFEAFTDDFFTELWEIYPGWASYLGLHQYDSIVALPSEENRQKTIEKCKSLQTRLAEIDVTQLEPLDAADYYLIENQLASTIWYSTEFRSNQWNPSNYGIAGSVSRILNGKYDSLDARLISILARLKHSKAYYEVAKQNIDNPTLEHTNLAILQSKGGLSSFGQKLVDSVNASTLTDSQKQLFMTRIEESKMAIQDYVDFLEALKKDLEANDSARSFRIGKDVFAKKFELDINSDYSASEIYEKALKRKEELHSEMITIADSLWDDYLPTESKPADGLKMVSSLIGEISKKHIKRDELVDEIRRQIPELEAFVNEKDLLTQNPDKPLKVRETPLYMRGVAGASVSAPGPFDKNATTYYNITPLDDYSEEQAESYLREYNHYILQILNIHEGIPGHYTQLMYANESPSLVKSILGNGAMIEGWANYAELAMMEAGYNKSPEMMLMYYKWHLRSVCNVILDYQVHCLNLSKEGARDLLINEAFQENSEVEEKWNRATVSQVQLCSYFTGFTEIYDLREELRALEGDNFDVKSFHEEFLSYGSSPVRFIRQFMIEDKE